MIENVRFGRATEQIFSITSLINNSAKEKSFRLQPAEDVLKKLAHLGLMTGVANGNPATLANPWGQSISVWAITSHAVRLETNVPARGCRRMTIFFIPSAQGLGLRALEARSEFTNSWKRIYDTNSITELDEPLIESACGSGKNATLAFVFIIQG